MKHKCLPGLFSLMLILTMGQGVVRAEVQPTLSAPAAEITVNHSGDLPDADGGFGVCETVAGNGLCTLRAAIQTAEYAGGADVITVLDSIVVIGPDSALPILGLGGVTIVGNGVYLSGLNAGSGVRGFEISSNNNKIQGFRIFGFSTGVYIYGGDNNVVGVDGDGVDDATEGNKIFSNTASGVYVMGSNTRISGNYIGTDNGSNASPNNRGVYIDSGTGNLIGTDGDGVSDALERNVISGNDGYGIDIRTNSNTVAGNYIGVNAAGSAAMGNDYGIWIADGAAYNVIGTNSDGSGDTSERNVISGNTHAGVSITGAGTNQNRVAGNYIGLDESGSLAIPNGNYGASVTGGARNNIIGTNSDGQVDAAERNVIAGNGGSGVYVAGDGTRGNKVAGNYIGVTATGLSALGNQFGVHVGSGASNNTVGGVAPAAPNVISGNAHDGIYLYESGTSNLIAGNLIGTDKTGLAAIPNGECGISSVRSAGNIIGATAAGARNVISGNGSCGVSLADSSSSDNSVQGNYIGVGLDGVTPLGNGVDGVTVWSEAHHNTIGGVAMGLTNSPAGPAPEGGNVIANNGRYGVKVGSSLVGNAIRGNAIYNNADLGIYSDADVGIPVLYSAVALDDPDGLSVSGVLTGTPNVHHELDFFVNELCDPSGEGEGQDYVGSTLLVGTPSGRMPFVSMTFPGSYTPGHFVTATATDGNGTSSQFSWCVVITPRKFRVYLPLASRGSVP